MISAVGIYKHLPLNRFQTPKFAIAKREAWERGYDFISSNQPELTY